MSGVTATVAALLLIAILITIHEFGHFIVAKACGVDVRVFSIGIGGRAFGVRWRGTDYRVSWFPFGGYVRMAGADPFMDGGDPEMIAEGDGSFMRKPVWKRLLIVGAGPAMNLLLPFVVFSILLIAGEPQERSDVGTVLAGSVGESAGVRVEDRIVAVNGVRTSTWPDLLDEFARVEQDPVTLTVAREGAERDVVLDDPDALATPLTPWDYGIWATAPDTTVLIDDPASPAAKAGLATGDRVVAVGGTAVRDLNAIARLMLTAGDRVALQVEREGETREVSLAADPAWLPEAREADAPLWKRWGVASYTTGISSFDEDSAAEEAGLREGDRLLAVDGRAVHAWTDVVRAVAASAEGRGEDQTVRSIGVQVRREGRILDFDVTPRMTEVTDDLGRWQWRPLLAIRGGGEWVTPERVRRPYPPVQAVARGTKEVATVAGFIVEQLGKLTTGEAAADKSLGGPVEIFRQTRAAAERGIFDWARQLGLFSISLGIINLLPIPVLDGGQLAIYTAEWIRGRPLPLVLRERAQQAGVIFLVLLMLFVLVFDIHRALVG